MSAVVEQTVQARLVITTQRSAELTVTLRYRSDDPLAVRMLFPIAYSLDPVPESGPPHDDPEPEIEWVFARQLLATGLDTPSGLGDVQIRPMFGQRTAVELRAPEGTALLRFDTAPLRRFLWRTRQVVPESREAQFLDHDRTLAELLR